MRKTIVLFWGVLFFPLATFADETLRFTAETLSGGEIDAGRQNVPLVLMRVVNEGEAAHALTSIPVVISAATADIAAGSVRLYDAGSNVQYGGDQTLASGPVVFPVAIPFNPKEEKQLRVQCDVATGAGNGDTITANLTTPSADGSGATVAGSFPLTSLSGSYLIKGKIREIKLALENVPSPVTAGQAASFTVAYVDEDGVLVSDAAGGDFSVTGTAQNSPLGNAPEYGWGAVSGGRRSCSFTLYRVQTGRTITASDSSCGTITSGAIDVAAGAARRVAAATIGGQTAGAPFNVQLYVSDAYGNAVAGSGGTTTLSAESGIETSPGGQSSNLPVSYTWNGDEGGKAAVSVIIYNRSSAARLRTADSGLEGALSNSFTVASAAAAAIVIGGPGSARLKTATDFTVSLNDAWGNPVTSYNGTVDCDCTDGKSAFPDRIAIAGGKANFTGMFKTMGTHTITLKSGSSLKGSITVVVDKPPLPDRFAVAAPSAVTAGVPFAATVTALDSDGQVIPEYTNTVTLTLAHNAAITPSRIPLTNGRWQGSLMISGETFQALLTVSDGDVSSSSAAVINVAVSDYERARAYPTVFTPRSGALRIRYYLRENRHVTVRIYNTLMDKVRELSFDAGATGGIQGLNVVEWDGRGGDNEVGHSGGYHILIDKGYEKEWTGGIIKNY